MSTEPPRLHYSIARILLDQSPWHAQQAVEGQRKKVTPSMRRGSLVDMLVFGQARFQVIDAKLSDGRAATNYQAKEARAQRDEIEAKGWTACFQSELEKARDLAGRVKAMLLTEGWHEGWSAQCTLQWDTALGIEAEGTPDLFLNRKWSTSIDLKETASCHPDAVDRAAYDQHWDMQGAVYQEALGNIGTHFILAQQADGECTLSPLSEASLHIGRMKWERAQRIWQRCLDTNDWPGYKGRAITPPAWAYEKETRRGNE